jgi:hypothetical protein
VTGPHASCSACGGALAEDQRYCLNCGTRREGGGDARAVLRETPPAIAAGPTSPPVTGAGRLSLGGLEVPLAAALGVFALVLGLAAWAGASTMRPGPGPAPIALAGPAPPAVEPATPLPPPDDAALGDAPPATADPEPGDLPPAEPVDAGTAALPADEPAPAQDPAPSGGGEDPAPGGEPPADDGPAAPSLEHVFLVVLADRGYDTLFDPEGAARYLNGTLVPKGTLLSRSFGVSSGALANGIALVSGQGPNAATREDCPAFADLTPGTIGKDDQAAGNGCGFSTDVFSVGDLLVAQEKTWRAYAGDLDGRPACPKPAAGQPFPLPRLPFLAFRTVTEDPACADRLTGLARLTEDLEDARTTPALSYLVPSACENGSDRACAPGAPAGLGPADAFLRRVVPQIQASPAYQSGGAIVILADQAPPGPEADRSACCEDRRWYGRDPASSGGGRTGALLLSPLVKGGTTVDTAIDHYDVLRTVSEALGVRRSGYAAREEVGGIPREAWTGWKP